MCVRGESVYSATVGRREYTHHATHRPLLIYVFIISLVLVDCCVGMEFTMSEKRRLELKDTAKEMFFHGWDNYIRFAYPEDELNPMLCNGRGSDKLKPDNININDILGDYSLTLVDTLDTLAVMGEQKEFEKAVRRVIDQVSFHQDNKVQIFELNIRALGGLLSAHILASEPSLGHTIPGYKGELLAMAQDLADRLMPAFQYTKTGIPFPRVNLKYGVPKTETVETCTAGAGSLLLEFGVLSRLTGNPHYEQVAKRALHALWNRRSDLNLLGNVINIQTGQWIHTASSTGAGIDSYFEYLLKAYVLFGDPEYLEMFEESYEAIMQHVRDPGGYLYRNVHMSTGALMATWIDSLSAFWPGVQVLYGDLDAAVKGHLVFYNIWRKYHALPERFDFYRKTVDIGFYPLRPEFIESTYYLYRATRDPFYLHVGEMVIEDLNNRTRLPCGFASVGDVRTGRLEDRMESFLLSETLKYLYLLFDTDNEFNAMDSNFVFTTEGHFLPLATHHLTTSNTSHPQYAQHTTCYNPHFKSALHHYIQHPHSIDMSSIAYQPETDYASALVGNTKNTIKDLYPSGQCTSPTAGIQSFDITFNSNRRGRYRHTSPKLMEVVGGFLAKSLSGLKVEITKRPSRAGGGYQVTRVYPNLRLTEDQMLMVPMKELEEYLQDEALDLDMPAGRRTTKWAHRHVVEMRLQGSSTSHMFAGVESAFGPSFSGAELHNEQAVIFLYQDDERLLGCNPYTDEDKELIKGRVLIVSRGSCTFSSKALWAQDAGATAVVFVNNEPTSGAFRALTAEMDTDTNHIYIPSMTLSLEDGIELASLLSDPELRMDFVKPFDSMLLPLSFKEPVRLLLHQAPVHNFVILHNNNNI